MARLPEGLVIEAAKYWGVPYVWGGTSLKGGVDCSGYVLAVYGKRGLSFPSRLTAQGIKDFCVPVRWEEVQPGDLIFLQGPEEAEISHVAISLGVHSGRVWSAQESLVREVVVAGNDWWQSRMVAAGRHPEAPVTALSNQRDARFSFDQVWPVMVDYGELYGVDPKYLLAMALVESPDYEDPSKLGVVNRLVHDDGHGRGLFGLDDRYLLNDFHTWSGSTWVGDGGSDGSISPVLQIEFVASWLSRTSGNGVSLMQAARIWHAGHGGALGPNGDRYERLIRERLL